MFVAGRFSTNVEWSPQSKGEKMAKTRESSSLTMQSPRVANNQPTQEEIALRAYHIYLERGGMPGNELEDWIEAERQLSSENSKLTENGNSKGRRKPKVNSAAAYSKNSGYRTSLLLITAVPLTVTARKLRQLRRICPPRRNRRAIVCPGAPCLQRTPR